MTASVYDTATLNVSPGQLYYSSEMLTGAATDVVDALNSINATLNGLQLGWAGTTAAEAKDFADEWTAAMVALFGNGKDTDQGTLNQMITLVATAAGNFGGAEQAITQMFTGMYDTLTTHQLASANAPIPALNTMLDATQSAVGESNWSTAPAATAWPTVP